MNTTERLKSLGDAAEEVAESLLKLGFRGARGDCQKCPVILFVNSDEHIKRWGGMKAPGPGCITWDDVQMMDPMCPSPVAEFMRRFDNGEFSELFASPDEVGKS